MSILSQINSILINKISRYSRKIPNQIKPYFVPIDIKSLDATLGSIIQEDIEKPLDGVAAVKPEQVSLVNFKNKLVNFLSTKYSNKIIIDGKSLYVNGKANVPLDIIVSKHTPALIYNKKEILGVLFDSLDVAQADLLNAYLNKEMLSFLKSTTNTNKSFDFGIAFKSAQSNPEKISKTIGILNRLTSNTIKSKGLSIDESNINTTKIISFLDAILREYVRVNKVGAEVETVVKATLGDFLNSIRADILIIQDSDTNPELERAIRSSDTVQKITEVLKETTIGKTSLIDSLKSKIVSFLKDEKGSKSASGIFSLGRLGIFKNLKTKLIGAKGKTSNFEVPEVLSANLFSIKQNINNELHDAIRDNMGIGDSSDVLNYRTGRFAKSAEVQALTQNRQGAITAFYSYMRYPYGTFGLGGRQQRPRSRDPKLLIDRSIRQIMRDKVDTRFRTVLI